MLAASALGNTWQIGLFFGNYWQIDTEKGGFLNVVYKIAYTFHMGDRILKPKQVLRKQERTTLSVDKNTHLAVRLYAKRRGISVAQATWELLGRALCEDEGIELQEHKD
jgi:hypothetical protein